MFALYLIVALVEIIIEVTKERTAYPVFYHSPSLSSLYHRIHLVAILSQISFKTYIKPIQELIALGIAPFLAIITGQVLDGYP